MTSENPQDQHLPFAGLFIKVMPEDDARVEHRLPPSRKPAVEPPPLSQADVEARIEASSLGTPAARRLRERTRPADAAALLELSRLTSVLEQGQWWQMAPLARWYQQHGEPTRAEQILRALAERALHEVADINTNMGNHDAAKVWDARADTLK